MTDAPPLRVLFVSHSGGRTGAPIVLANLVRWWQGHGVVSPTVVFLDSGPVAEELRDEAEVIVLPPRPPPGVLRSFLRRTGLTRWDLDRRWRRLVRSLRRRRFDLIYANTITVGDALERLAPLGCPVLTHVHELDSWIRRSGAHNLALVRRHTTRYVAVSEAVRRSLVERHGIAAEACDVVHAFVASADGPAPDRSGLRARLSLPRDAFVVVGAGYETRRKGKDLFVELAGRTRALIGKRDLRFVWLGGWEDDEAREQLEEEVRRNDLEETVNFVGEVTNPSDWFAAADVFAMTSREDPFPLVCLEAASVGTPIVCFSDAGGSPELVEEDAGFVVPYLDVETMAMRLVELADDPRSGRRLGERAAEKVRERHRLELAAEQLRALAARTIAEGRRG